MNKPTKSDVQPGCILRSTAVKTDGGSVLILETPTGSVVRVQVFDRNGNPYNTSVPLSTLRWL